jgi:TRAP-type C4-dicarboxylate transport system permease small subunit
LKAFREFVSRLSDACAVIAGVLLALAIAVIVYMIVRRFTGFSTDWELEFAVFMMVSSLFLGSPYCLKTEGHVAVGLLETALSPRNAAWLRFGSQVLGLVVVLFLAYMGYEKTLESFLQGEVTESSWAPPKWPLFATMPIGLGLTALQYIALIELPFSSRREQPNV